MARPQLSNAGARAIFLDRHALAESPTGPANGRHLLGLIERLGFVQIDSINTLARAHDLILFARRPRYRPADLKRLYERDGALFEHWTHDAAIIPMQYFPWWSLRRARDAKKLQSQWKSWRRGDFNAQLQAVLDQVRATGPVTSSDVGRGEKRGSGGWWDWHPSKTALEFLWRSGALAVVGREGFQKRYDLTERAIDPQLNTPANPPSDEDAINWFCAGALDRLGFASPAEIAAFWGHLTLAEVKDWCAQQQSQRTLQEIEIKDSNGGGRAALCRPELLDQPLPRVTNRLRVLSPFDPALRDRKRANLLFGFDYRIEIFVPEARRKYGYYVFPILHGDRIIGRIDMKAQRQKDTLEVRALWPERGIKWGVARTRALEAELHRLCRLAGVTQVSWLNDWLRAPQ